MAAFAVETYDMFSLIYTFIIYIKLKKTHIINTNIECHVQYLNKLYTRTLLITYTQKIHTHT